MGKIKNLYFTNSLIPLSVKVLSFLGGETSMKILLSPKLRDRNKIWYDIKDQKITATINGVSDTFDFTDVPDGELQLYDNNGKEMVETILSEVPIVSARKTNNVLWIEILFTIELNEKDKRLLFPDWMTLEEFNKLMKEHQEDKKTKLRQEELSETIDG